MITAVFVDADGGENSHIALVVPYRVACTLAALSKYIGGPRRAGTPRNELQEALESIATECLVSGVIPHLNKVIDKVAGTKGAIYLTSAYPKEVLI